jgi:hypothetical protein
MLGGPVFQQEWVMEMERGTAAKARGTPAWEEGETLGEAETSVEEET